MIANQVTEELQLSQYSFRIYNISKCVFHFFNSHFPSYILRKLNASFLEMLNAIFHER
jgi:hypothetical protein